MVDIIYAKSYEDIDRAKRLFVELSTCLDFAILFRSMQNELENLSQAYTPPEGCLHFAVVDMQIVGCSAVKKIDQHTCEFKRLYVLPGFRKKGIGKTLARTAINEATKLGYKTMQLTTVPSMKPAIAVYSSLVFRLIEPKHGQSTKSLYMKLALTGSDFADAV